MLFVGDDWAEHYHDIEVVDEAEGRSARSADHPEPPPTTSSSAPATTATKQRYVSSPTASSASPRLPQDRHLRRAHRLGV